MSKRRVCLGLSICIILVIMLFGIYKLKTVWFHFNQRIDALILNSEAPNDICLTIDGQPVHLNMEASDLTFEVPSLNTEFPLTISYTANQRYNLDFSGITMTNGEPITYKIDSIAPGYYVPVKAYDNLTKKTIIFNLRTYPQALPGYTVTGKSPYPGDYYITPSLAQGGVIIKIDSSGHVLYYKITGTMAIDFKKVKTKDGIRYIYCEQVPSQYTPLASIYVAEYIVMDEQYHEIKRIRMLKSDIIADDSYPCDAHDILYISDDEYYLMTYVNQYVKNIPDNIPQRKPDTLVTAVVIQGFKNGHLAFEWNSAYDPELYSESTEGNDYTNSTDVLPDYAHANSLDLDERDGNLIVSFRHLDCILKIDTSTGKILWTLGGSGDDFHLTPEQKTSHQHFARYNADGSITAFDNGNASKQSRVVQYWLDEKNKTLKSFKSYQIDGYFSWATGSAQKLPVKDDVFVIGWGTRDANTLPLQPNMSEIDFTTGNTLFELRFDDKNLQTYRCVKYE